MMAGYAAPLREYRFILQELLALSERLRNADGEPLNEALIDAVLAGGARLVEDVWAPLNQTGDQSGCHFENGVVRTPQGFREALAAYYAGGWNALSADPAIGGQGLPGVLGQCMSEMAMSANLSLSTYVGLSMGVMGVTARLAPPEIRDIYVAKLMSGEWTGTMNLTEPHCGTDLRLMRTRAVEQEDGSYRISGSKIFITGGDHDMAENIVHLVLAKIPEAGDGLSAVNLFLVPKFLVNPDGSIGAGNNVRTGGIENKMGIRGSVTAQLHYEQSWGIRLGSRPKPPAQAGKGKKRSSAAGMAGMFALMNGARIGVGMQGIAIAEAAYQHAVAYARERTSGRALGGARYPDQPADPIIVHPDVRRMLLHARAFVEAGRALVMWLGMERSAAEGAEARQQADDVYNLLTPVVKAHFSDLGFECANMAMQCFGGHGYLKDHPMEQFVRDVRISQLYEGANGVQALDLVGRRLNADDGRAVRALFSLLQKAIAAAKNEDALSALAAALEGGTRHLQEATLWLAQNAPQRREEAGAGASDYLRLMGTVMLGLMWLKMAETAHERLAGGAADSDFYAMKLETAGYYMARVMPDTAALLGRVKAGADTLMAAEESWF
jgi:alkylation response protein AidB-like acyl-CoA dehydrogenase